MKVYGIARLVKDAEVKEFDKGKILKLRIASDEGYGDEKRTLFIDADYFVNKDSKIADYLKKGKGVFIEGYLRTDKWEKDGKKYSKTALVVNSLKLLGGNGKQEGSGSGKGTGKPAPSPSKPTSDDDDFDF